MKKEYLVLVDKRNRKIGVAEKIKAHQEGKLHRAFSIFIFNDKGELLLQKRAKNKYHSPSIWSNTVCGHPRPGENFREAARRRLKEEMGFNCSLKKVFCFIYRKEFFNKLTEHEYDCVYKGFYEGKIKPNRREIMDYRWIKLNDLKQDLKKNKLKYSYWLDMILKKNLF